MAEFGHLGRQLNDLHRLIASNIGEAAAERDPTALPPASAGEPITATSGDFIPSVVIVAENGTPRVSLSGLRAPQTAQLSSDEDPEENGTRFLSLVDGGLDESFILAGDMPAGIRHMLLAFREHRETASIVSRAASDAMAGSHRSDDVWSPDSGPLSLADATQAADALSAIPDEDAPGDVAVEPTRPIGKLDLSTAADPTHARMAEAAETSVRLPSPVHRSGAAGFPPATPYDLARLSEALLGTIGLAPVDGLSGPLQIERAGVLASFILNAAMIPGWPPPRPLEGVPSRERATGPQTFAQQDTVDEHSMQEFLAHILRDPALLAKLVRMIGRKPGGKHLLGFLGILLTSLDSLASAILVELEALLEQEGSAQKRTVGRHILPLAPNGKAS